MKTVNRRLAPRRAGRGERGSAYVIALLVLLLLTVIGLSLSLITRNEMQIGANERLINRVFYATDSAAQEFVTHGLVTNCWDEKVTSFQPDANALPGTNLGIRVQSVPPGNLDRVVNNQVNLFYCNLCETNSDYKVVSFRSSFIAKRTGNDSGGAEVSLAEKQLTADLSLQPFQPQLHCRPLEDSSHGARLEN